MASLAKGQKTKEHIKDVATYIFYKKGYHKTTVSDICRASGTVPGIFTYHYKSKEELAVNIYRNYTITLNDIIDKYMRKRFPDVEDLVFDAITYRAFFIAHAQNKNIRLFYTEICDMANFIETNKAMDKYFATKIINSKIPKNKRDPMAIRNHEDMLTMINGMEINYTREIFAKNLSGDELNDKIDLLLLYYYRFFLRDNNFILDIIKKARDICSGVEILTSYDDGLRISISFPDSELL